MLGMGKRDVLTGVAVVAVAAGAAARRRSREPASGTDDTQRVRDLYDREAARYDSIVRIPERLLFTDGRVWATTQAARDVLEIAIGTAVAAALLGLFWSESYFSLFFFGYLAWKNYQDMKEYHWQ